MRTLHIVMLALLILLVTCKRSSAQTDFDSGHYWLRVCSIEEPSARLQCISYLRGFEQGRKSQHVMTDACIPAGVSFLEVIDVIGVFAANNPRLMQEHFGVLASRALNSRWPCDEELSALQRRFGK